MENWLPNLTGGAERAPGSQFLLDTGASLHARIVPYRAATGEKSLLQLTEGTIARKTGVVTSSSRFASVDAIGDPTRQIVVNSHLGKGTSGEWTYGPTQYTADKGDTLGMTWGGGFIRGNCRKWQNPDKDKNYMDIATTAEVDIATDSIAILYDLAFTNQFVEGGYTLDVKIGTTLGGGEVYSESWDTPGVYPPRTIDTSRAIPGGAFTGTLYFSIHVVATYNNGQPASVPNMALNYLELWAATDPPPADVSTTVPYLAEELSDIHYVASPYDFAPNYVKPVIFVHPNHPPSWFFWDGDVGAYAFEEIDFTTGTFERPSEWHAGNYPSTCTSSQGRLVLGGCPEDSETVWLTRVTEWNKFVDPNSGEPITPEAAMDFTTIYRSPIQWMSGHKSLLVGTTEIEYLAHADGIFQPSDLGVSVQTTHGGSHVQPAGFGQSVLFSAEAGQRIREAKYSNEDGGWVAPDLTVWHPDLCSSGVVRLVRMRNPHQMLVAILGNGQIALLHQDSYLQIAGWSRINLNAHVIDTCVIADDEGVDVLYILVRRVVAGVKKLYLEAFSDWTDFDEQQYLSSFTHRTNIDGATHIIDGLAHLEGEIVQVVGDGEYLGSFPVLFNQVSLISQVGTEIPVTTAVVGRTMNSKMRTLPPPSTDPGSMKRYTDVSVRVRGSTTTIINEERVKDRTPSVDMGTSEPLTFVNDYKVANLGYDKLQIITIEETVPFRSEVLGIYGTVQEHSV